MYGMAYMCRYVHTNAFLRWSNEEQPYGLNARPTAREPNLLALQTIASLLTKRTNHGFRSFCQPQPCKSTQVESVEIRQPCKLSTLIFLHHRT